MCEGVESLNIVSKCIRSEFVVVVVVAHAGFFVRTVIDVPYSKHHV